VGLKAKATEKKGVSAEGGKNCSQQGKDLVQLTAEPLDRKTKGHNPNETAEGGKGEYSESECIHLDTTRQNAK